MNILTAIKSVNLRTMAKISKVKAVLNLEATSKIVLLVLQLVHCNLFHCYLNFADLRKLWTGFGLTWDEAVPE